MVFAQSTASPDAYRLHYSHHSKYHSRPQASASEESLLEQIRFDNVAKELVQEAEGRIGSVLDIGAARGGLLKALRTQGVERVVGMDPSPGCVAAMKADNIEAFTADLETPVWPIENELFDRIILSHVVEHLYDATAGLKMALRVLAPHGAVYVEVPDAARYVVDGFPPYYFFDPEHINHFDLATLTRLACQCGLDVARVRYGNLEVGSSRPYPAIGVWMKPTTTEISPQFSGPAVAVGKYAEACRKAWNASLFHGTIRDCLAHNKPLLIWGAGSYTQRLLSHTWPETLRLLALVDSDPGKQGRCIAGIPVLSPQEGIALAVRHQAKVLIAVALGGQSIGTMVQEMAPELEWLVC
ncbi:MAG: methyltransferase domain-containing protein [Magnetococcus sp. DMHC-1]